MNATAKAHTNIALVKYWGKNDPKLNIPAVGSISITLKDLFTITTVELSSEIKSDKLWLNGKRADPFKERRASNFLNLLRNKSGVKSFAKITSENNFPTGAGLASSASGFAALACAGSDAFKLKLSQIDKSILARMGSGSAPRSIFGGFVEMKRGSLPDGSDSYAVQLADENHWPLSVIIVVTAEHEKSIGSTEGMKITKESSPYYNSWIDSSETDLSQMKQAIKTQDFEKLGSISENSCLKMHALMFSSKPPLLYWNETTLSVIHHVRAIRKKGISTFFTIDAGPQVKILCDPKHVNSIESEMMTIPGVKRIHCTSIGPSAHLLGENGIV